MLSADDLPVVSIDRPPRPTARRRPPVDRRRRERTEGRGPRGHMDREARNRLMIYVKAWNRRHKARGQHIGPLTRTDLELLPVLMSFIGSDGYCTPDYRAIMRRGDFSRAAVADGITRLEAAGVIRVVNRKRRIGGHKVRGQWVGGKVVNIENAYCFLAVLRGAPPKSKNQTTDSALSLSQKKGPSAGAFETKEHRPTRWRGLESALGRLGETLGRWPPPANDRA
jgi:hypothetical protein